MKKINLLLCCFVTCITFVKAQVIFEVTSPISIANQYSLSYASSADGWGVGDLTNPMNAITGELMFVEDGSSGTNAQGNPISREGCNTLINDLTGKIAVIYRNTCEFGTKALNAQSAGAIGVVIINRDDVSLNIGSGVDGINVYIPVILISNTDGNLIANEMNLSNTVNVFIGSPYYNNNMSITENGSFIPSPITNRNVEMNGFTPSFEYSNDGSQIQNNVIATCQITYGGNVLYNESVNIGSVLNGNVGTVSFPIFSQTTYLSGTYTLSYSLTADETEEYPSDNLSFLDFYLTNGIVSYAQLDAQNKPTPVNFYKPSSMTSEFSSCMLYKTPPTGSLELDGIYFSAQTNNGSTLMGQTFAIDIYEWNDVFTDMNDPNYTNLSSYNITGFHSVNYDFTSEAQSTTVYADLGGLVLTNNTRYLACVLTYDLNTFLGYTNLNYTKTNSISPQPIAMNRVDFQFNPLGFGDQYVAAIGIAISDNSVVSSSDAFISEYGEGSSNNKYIEIYNPTNNTIDLSTYSIKLFSNGSATANSTLNLSGNLAPYDVYIVANTSANASILAQADLISGGVTSFNGNDALQLLNASTVIDRVGIEGINPGTSWSVAGDVNGAINHTLKRKSSVCTPNPDWNISSGIDEITSEWIIMPNDDITNLGSHTSFCDLSACPNPIVDLTVNNEVICSGTSATLSANPQYSGSSIYWYDSEFATLPFFTGTTYSTPPLTSNVTFWVQEDLGLCGTSQRVSSSVIVDPTPNVFAGNDTLLCQAGMFLFNPTGGVSYTWDNGVIDGVPFNITSTTTFNVTGYGANGCSATDDIVVSINSTPPTITASDDITVCSGTSVTLTASGSGTISWSNGITNSTPFIPLNTQTYTATVTDLNGCTATEDVLVTVNMLPMINAGIDENVCLGNQVTLTALTSGTVVWNNGVTDGVSFSPGSTLTYTATATDLNGCISSDDVVVNVLSLPNIEAGIDTAACQGNGLSLNATSTSTISWNNGVIDGVIFVPTNSQYYVATATDANNCVNKDSLFVTVKSLPNVNAGSDFNVCGSSEITLSGNGALTYTWDNGVLDGVPFTITNTSTFMVTGLGVNGCTNYDEITVTVNSIPSINAGNDVSICLGESTSLSASGTGTITWDNAIQDGVSFTPSVTQTYTATITDINGCSSSDEVIVTVNSLPFVNAGSDLSICLGESTSLSASGTGTITWDNGIQDGVSFTPSVTQTYTATITDINGCSSSDEVLITVNDLPQITLISQNPSACGFNNGMITVNGTGSVSLHYSGAAFGTQTGNLPLNISDLGSGVYMIHVFDQNGCMSSIETTTLTEPGAPAAPIISSSNGTELCPGSSTILSSNVGGNIIWSNGETGTSINVNSNGFGSYYATLTENGCSSSSNTIEITQLSAPMITLNAQNSPSSCGGSDATIEIIGSSGMGNLSWSGSSNGVLNNVSLPQTISNLSAGSYAVVFEQACISNTISVSISDPGAPSMPNIVADGPLTFCEGGSVNLTSDVTNGITWSNGLSSASINVNSSGVYYVSVSAGNCSSTSLPITVNVLSNPTVDAGNDLSVCFGNNVTLSANGTGVFSWNNGVQDGMTFTPSVTQTYTVTTTASNGCEVSDEVIVTVNNLPQISLSNQNPSACGTNDGSIIVNGTGEVYMYYSGTETGNDLGTLPLSIDNVGAGVYYVHVVDFNGCMSSTETTTLTDPGAPTAPIISSSNGLDLCPGTSTILSSNISGNLIWSNGENGNSIVVSAEGTYYATLTENGCSSISNMLNINELVSPIINLSSQNSPSSCGGSDASILISGTSGNGSLTWSGTSNGSINNIQLPQLISNLTAGSYSVVFEQACSSNLLSISISDPGAPATPVVVADGPTEFCSGQSVNLISNVTSGITWSNGLSTASINVNTTGVYYVTVSAGNCSSTSLPISVNVLSNPTVDAGTDVSICLGQDVTLTANGTGTVSWNNGVQDGVAFMPSITQTYSATINDANGCSASDDVLVTVNSLPTIDAGSNVAICFGSSVTLTATGTGNITWNNGVINGEEFTPSVTQTYTASIVDVNSCQSTDEVEVTVNSLPNVDAGTDMTICDIDQVTFSATGAVSYNWDYNIINDVLIYGSEIGVPFNEYITVHVTGTDANNCSSSDSLVLYVDICGGIHENISNYVSIYPNPSIDFINVTVSDNMKINYIIVLDNLGRKVFSSNNISTIDVSHLSNGKYFLQLIGEQTIVKSFEVIK
ncbi:MAG: lamin tail domain-containing protein [Flavobacteriia bacterium]|nr:lamin tail domain-containing protein [Flavobacteriia bacterium]